MEKENKDKDEKLSTSERASLKNAINNVKPGTVDYKGLEHLNSPTGQAVKYTVPLMFAAIAAGAGAKGAAGRNTVNNYIARGRSPEAKQQRLQIAKENKGLMSQPPSRDVQDKLIDNTRKEVTIPRDNLKDTKMDYDNYKELSEKEIKDIKEKKLKEFDSNQKPLNNLEATRPDRGTLGHSKDTARITYDLVKSNYPKIPEALLRKIQDAIELHDYGKGMTPYGSFNSKTGRTYEKELFDAEHRPLITPHDRFGKEALEAIGEDLAAFFAGAHHSKVEKFDDLAKEANERFGYAFRPYIGDEDPVHFFKNLIGLVKSADIFNAKTGARPYIENPDSYEDAIKDMEGFARGKQVPEEAFDMFKESVLSGKVRQPKNDESELNEIYRHDAGKAVRDAGIDSNALWNAENPVKSKVLEMGSLGVLGLVSAGHPGLALQAKNIQDEHKAKIKALINVTRGRNFDEWAKLKSGYYKYDKEAVDKLFEKYFDEIVEDTKKN